MTTVIALLWILWFSEHAFVGWLSIIGKLSNGVITLKVCLFIYRETQLAQLTELGREERKENAQKMYDAMTRHYARVFRGRVSPFHSEWINVEHLEAFGGDKMLAQRFHDIKLAEKIHCKALS